MTDSLKSVWDQIPLLSIIPVFSRGHFQKIFQPWEHFGWNPPLSPIYYLFQHLCSLTITNALISNCLTAAPSHQFCVMPVSVCVLAFSMLSLRRCFPHQLSSSSTYLSRNKKPSNRMNLSGSPCGTPVSLQISPLTYVNSLPFSTGCLYTISVLYTILLPLPVASPTPKVTPHPFAALQDSSPVQLLTHGTPKLLFCHYTEVQHLQAPWYFRLYENAPLIDRVHQAVQILVYKLPCPCLPHCLLWYGLPILSLQILSLSLPPWWKGPMESGLTSILKTRFLEAFPFDNDSPQVTNF